MRTQWRQAARLVGGTYLNKHLSGLSPQQRELLLIDAYLKAAAFPINPGTHAVGGVSCSRPVTYRVIEKSSNIGLPYSDDGVAYGRYIDSPGQIILERALSFVAQGASDCTAKSKVGGEYVRPLAVAVPTGMSALANVLQLIQNLKGKRDISIIVAPDDCYGGTRSLIGQLGINVAYASDSTEAALQAAYDKQKCNTAAIVFETLTNPFGHVADIDAIVRFAKERNILTIADSTLAPFTRPVLRGADVDTISLTKYHTENQVILGAIVFNERRVELLSEFIAYRNMNGAVPGEHEIRLALSGLATMVDSYKRHSENANLLAEWLLKQPQVSKVFYPGLGENPQKELAERYLGNYRGGLMTIELKGGRQAAERFIEATCLPLEGYGEGLPDDERRIIITADSFGAPRTLVNYMRTQMSRYRAMSREQCAQAGVSEGTLRVAVGTQDSGLIIAAFAQALATAPKRYYRRRPAVQAEP